MFMLLHSFIRHNFMFILSFERKPIYFVNVYARKLHLLFMFHLSYFLSVNRFCMHDSCHLNNDFGKMSNIAGNSDHKLKDFICSLNHKFQLQTTLDMFQLQDYLFRNIFSLFQNHCRMLPNLISYYSYFNNLV